MSPRAGEPDVSVIVLSYDRPGMLRDALAALATQTLTPAEIIVVDNPSPHSPEVDRVVAAHPGVRLVRPERNLGFAGGMNAGLREARGAWVFLTEDDIVLEPGCLAALHAHAATQRPAGVSTGLMLNHARGTVRSAGARASLAPVFRQEVIGWGAEDAGQFAAPFAADFVSGSAVYAPRALLAELGGFRDEFFMYYEDLELCLRVRARGLPVDVVPAARLHHLAPVPGPPPPNLEFHKMKNLIAVYLLHAPAAVLPEFLLRYGVSAPLQALVREPRRARDLVRAWLWALAWMPRLLRDRRRVHYIRPT